MVALITFVLRNNFNNIVIVSVFNLFIYNDKCEFIGANDCY